MRREESEVRGEEVRGGERRGGFVCCCCCCCAALARLAFTLQLSTESMFIRMGKCKRAIAAKAPDKARPMRQYNATVRQRRVVMRRARREARRRRRTRRTARMVPQKRGLRARAPVC